MVNKIRITILLVLTVQPSAKDRPVDLCSSSCVLHLEKTGPGGQDLRDHVLGEFSRSERKELDSYIADACDAVEHWIEEEDMGKVMTRWNAR